MIDSRRTLILVSSLALAVLVTVPSDAEIYVHGPFVDCNCVESIPGSCCEHQSYGLDLWQGYCFEKRPAYSRPIISHPLLKRKCDCLRCKRGSCQTPDCPKNTNCTNSTVGNADVPANRNGRQPVESENKTPTPAAEPAPPTQPNPITPTNVQPKDDSGDTDSSVDTADVSIDVNEPLLVDLEAHDVDDDAMDEHAESTIVGGGGSEDTLSTPDDEDNDFSIPSNEIQIDPSSDIPSHSLDLKPEVNDENQNEILDYLPENTINLNSDDEIDEEFKQQIQDLLNPADSTPSESDQASVRSVSFRKRLLQRQERIARRSKELNPFQGVRQTQHVSRVQPISAAIVREPVVRSSDHDASNLSRKSSARSLAESYRNRLSKRLRKDSDSHSNRQISGRLIDHLKYVAD